MALIYKYLVADAAAGRVEVHTVFLCKCLNISVFLQVACTSVLNIMIQRDNDLLWIVDSRGANGREFLLHRIRIIVRHTSERLKGDIISRLNKFAMGDVNGMPLHYFLGQGLRHERRRSASIVQLRVECLNILEMAGKRGERSGHGWETRK